MDKLEALRRENAALQKQLASDRTQLLQQNAQLVEQLARLNERVAELLAVAQRKQRKARTPSETPQPAAPPDVEGEQRRAFDEPPRAPEKPEVERTEKQKAKPTAREPLPKHLKAEEHELRPDSCASCGGHPLDVADVLDEEKLHVVKEHQRRRVVRRYTCRCRACGERTTLRPLPAPYERSKVTCDWLAWFVYQKFWLLTPFDRIRRDLAERGIPLAMSALVSFIERAADLLSGVDGLHWKQLLASSWMGTDGTGIKVIVPKPPTRLTFHSHVRACLPGGRGARSEGAGSRGPAPRSSGCRPTRVLGQRAARGRPRAFALLHRTARWPPRHVRRLWLRAPFVRLVS